MANTTHILIPEQTSPTLTYFKQLAREFILDISTLTRRKVTLLDTMDQALARKGFMLLRSGDQVQLLNAAFDETESYEVTDEELNTDFSGPCDHSLIQMRLKKLIPLQRLVKIWEGTTSDREILLYTPGYRSSATLKVISWGRNSMIFLSTEERKPGEAVKLMDRLGKDGFKSCNEPWIFHLLDKQNLPVYRTIPLESLLPSPQIPARKAVCDIVLNYLRSVRYYEPGVIENIDTECLHQYRVFLRKIRSLISLLGFVFPEEDSTWLKTSLRSIQQQTNRLRDIHVQGLGSGGLNGSLPAIVHDQVQSMNQEICNHETEEFKRVCELLKSEKYLAEIERIQRYFETAYQLPVDEIAVQPIGEVAHETLDQTYKKIRKRIRRIIIHSEDEAIHDLRIRFKKIRYLLEFFQPLFDKKSSKILLKRLRKVQNTLGDFNDTSVQQSELAEKYKPILDGKNSAQKKAFAAGVTYGVLHTRNRQLKDLSIERIQEFDNDRIHAVLRKLTR